MKVCLVDLRTEYLESNFPTWADHMLVRFWPPKRYGGRGMGGF